MNVDPIVDFSTVRVLWPEVMLILVAAWIYLGGTLQRNRLWWTGFSIAAYVAVGGVIYGMERGEWQQSESLAFLSGPVIVDHMGYYMRCMIVLLGALFTLVSSRSASDKLHTEVLATIMLLTVGLMLVVRANDLVLLFVSLELISIPTYVLLYLGRQDRATAEATVKYFFLSILSSALLLYGLSFLYGVTGTTTLVGNGQVASILTTSVVSTSMESSLGGVGPLVSLALVLLLAGFGFKIAAVPFHYYAPDVYQGVSNANAGLLAVAPKIAGVIGLVRVLVVAAPQAAVLGWQLVMILAMLTMTVGNVCALWQHNLRRMMAFSSIAHAGYMLIGISVAMAATSHEADYGGVTATILYLMVYALASLGTFAALAALSDEHRELDGVDALAGMGRSNPVVAAAIAVCMFSLAGIPPLAGFWGKLTLFGSALQAANASENSQAAFWFTALAIVGALNAAIAAAYYLRVVAVMYFQTPTAQEHRRANLGPASAMLICAVLVVTIGAVPRQAMRAATLSAGGLTRTTEPAATISERAANPRVQLTSH